MKKKFLSKIIAGALTLVLFATSLNPVMIEASNFGDSGYADFPDFYPENRIQTFTITELNNRVEGVLASMTQAEKYSMLGGIAARNSLDGDGTGYLKGVPRLGVPEIRMWDGPRGVQSNGVLETTLPASALAVASSFSEELAYDYGVLHAIDNKATGANVQLGPQVDHIRSPFFMRSRDSYSEDPYLTGVMAGETSEGMKDNNVIAVLKHLAGYTTMYWHPMMGGDNLDKVVVSEQALHETYLSAYRDIVKKDQATAVMASFNLLNGIHTPSDPYLLKSVLRDMWGFKGVTMTDWNSITKISLAEGMDMEMGTIRVYTPEALDAALGDGSLLQADIDKAVKHVLTALGQVGYLGLVQLNQSGDAMEDDMPPAVIRLPRVTGTDRVELLEENNKIALESAVKGAVLMKNEDNALPVNSDDEIAMIGLTGQYQITGAFMECSFGWIQKMTSPYENMKDILGEGAQITAEAGIDIVGDTIPETNLFIDSTAITNGITMTKDGIDSPLNSLELTTGTIDGNVNRTYKNATDGNALVKGEKATVKTYLKAPETGTYGFKLLGIGGTSTMKMTGIFNGETSPETKTATQTQTQWGSSGVVRTSEGMDIPTSKLSVNLVADQIYEIEITCDATVTAANDAKDLQMRLTWFTPNKDATDRANALKAAEDNDTVIFFAHDLAPTDGGFFNMVHRTSNWNLRDGQEELLKDVAAAAKAKGNKVIVVLNASLPVIISDWVDDVDAILNMWAPGQAGGTATAQLLTGAVNPSGKLAVSFPKNINDTPLGDQSNFNDPAKICNYSEGIFSGYRWYDNEGTEPEFAFGHGLSYTNFEYSNLNVQRLTKSSYQATVSVKNTGAVKGSEVVQLYLGAAAVPEGIQMAKYQLAGFARLEDMNPGETRTVSIDIDAQKLSYWDEELTVGEGIEKWIVAEGERTVYVGGAKPGATSDNIESATIDIRDIPVTGISVTPSSKTLTVNEKVSLQANVTPSNATNNAVTWSSSHSNIASVDPNSGEVTAKAAGGPVTITATAKDGSGKTGTCTITVQVKVTNPDIVTVTKPSAVKGLKVSSNTSKSIKLSWKKLADADGYTIYNGNKAVKSVNASVTSYNVKKLKTRTSYKLSVAAYKLSGSNKIYGAKKRINGKTLLTSASKPKLKSVKNIKGRKAKIIINKKVKNVTGYEIHMSTKRKSAYKKVATLKKNTRLNYTLTKGLKKGKTYYFKVRSYRKVNSKKYYSGFSSLKKIKITK